MTQLTEPTVQNQEDWKGVGFNNRRITYYNSPSATTIYKGQNDGIFLFDSAAGIVYTLPSPTIGHEFTFIVTVTATTNFHKVITNSASVFIVGLMYGVATDNSNTSVAYVANGTTHIAVKQNGTTTGGYIGDQYTLKCVSSTLWAVQGTMLQTGSTATPFSTS